ncbi:NtaA/DmoA family FMN-dependent monooxygenase [Gordonia sp. ABSL11-1]|uniref:NtaA/DmoA family FMN-dependent monooxygenase n=1 Tax=Gordonia sp. ABSL11-1 TaxID=3053924 RepID=UPI002572D521|nr:NtaA/DmoA family FMN-dependent monooxygenase [Gordonia sp. ABSL11-1]MDL9948124.1 NtaA/DmoA family FMN-dependent monooxygenase [Gordonia sp. ABSL11-1]
MTRQLIFNTVVQHRTPAGWLHPDAPDSAAELDINSYIRTAQLAEEAKFHSIFLADTLYVSDYLSVAPPLTLEPLVTLGAVASHTEHIGLIATVTTSFYPPYHIARLFNSLDHISRGRAGWNIVTSAQDAEAKAFGLDALPDHEARYEQAGHFVDAVLHLSHTWEPDALVRDRATGLYADLSKIDFSTAQFGPYKLGAPLDIPPSPQGHPVLVQAGRSASGIHFAGKYAEVVFSAVATISEAVTFRQQIRDAAARAGRNPDAVNIVPILGAHVGSTEEEARRTFEETERASSPRYAAVIISSYTGHDFGPDPHWDSPVPRLPDVAFNGQQGRYDKLRKLVDDGYDTLGKLQRVFTASRGGNLVVGTPEQITGVVEEWFHAGAVDGFSVSSSLLPGGLADFTREVIPLLQQKGLFREDYPEQESTFREDLRITSGQLAQA